MNRHRNHFAFVAALLILCSLPDSASAFQVLPRISDVDRELANVSANDFLDKLGQWLVSNAIPLIKSPVHEAITLRAGSCVNVAPGYERDCVTLNNVLENRTLLYGARWPDDPPFELNRKNPPRSSDCDPRITLRSTSQPKCWKQLFSDAEKKAKTRTGKNPNQAAFGPGDYLLYRSHFGDLQFIHSMAAYDGETAYETKRRMKMWAEFLWGIGIGDIPTDKFIRTLGVSELDWYFPGDMTAKNLFATGIIEVREKLNHVAIGVLLHMIQDSFSQAHADRKVETGGNCEKAPQFSQPGVITQFYSYAGQSGRLHDEEDTFDALKLQTLQRDPNVVSVARSFLGLWKDGKRWDEAEKYFDCVFSLEDGSAKASPGPYAK